MKLSAITLPLFLFTISARASGGFSVHCTQDPVLLEGVPYTQRSLSGTLDLTAKTWKADVLVHVLPPFHEPDQRQNVDNVITAIQHDLIFPAGCTNHCNAVSDRLTLHMAPGIDDSLTLTINVPPGFPERSTPFSADFVWNWNGISNDCDRGSCPGAPYTDSESYHCEVH